MYVYKKNKRAQSRRLLKAASSQNTSSGTELKKMHGTKHFSFIFLKAFFIIQLK